jgi:anti-sigma factor RsiW
MPEPIRTCRELEPMLAPYVDNEAGPGDRASVDAHLERCPPCRDRVAGERAARDVLRARQCELRGGASEMLRARCAAQAKLVGAGRRHAPVLRRIVPLSLAATLVLAVAGIFVFGVNREAVAAQLALDHLKCFDVVGEEGTKDPKTAEANWLARRGWTIGVPPSSPELDLELVGVRRCFSTDGAAAHCMYRWRDQALSVFIMPHATDDVASAQRATQRFGQDAIMWSSGGRTYLVVTRRRSAGLEAVTGHIRRHVK